MKHYSGNLNKRSRLTRLPQLMGHSDADLRPMDPTRLMSRVGTALKVQTDYFPCFDWRFPPPLFSRSGGPDSAAELFQQRSVTPGRYSLYLHSPFCASLCKFCYYTVIPGQRSDEMSRYVDYLIREMALYSEAMQGQSCESVYFGGGTPTFLDDASLVRIFDAIGKYFSLMDGAEIGIESAPGTIPASKLKLLKRSGVNRLSYGIQTLDTQLLAGLNRNYSVPAAIRELDDALTFIGNVNVDTMYGFNGEPDNALTDTLSTFADIGIPGLSIYSLDTQRFQLGNDHYEIPHDPLYDKKLSIFARARDYLYGQGFKSVLQNIFIKPGIGSYRHQVRRWENLSLIAMGISSMGYAPRMLYQNLPVFKTYYQHIDAGRLPIMETEAISPELEFAREFITQLRFTRADRKALRQKYGVDIKLVYADLIQALTELGYMEYDGAHLALSKDAARYNSIIPMLFTPDNFKQKLLGLPEDYREKFPIPYALITVGQTQSAPITPHHAGGVRP